MPTAKKSKKPTQKEVVAELKEKIKDLETRNDNLQASIESYRRVHDEIKQEMKIKPDVIVPPSLINKARVINFMDTLIENKSCSFLVESLNKIKDFIEKRTS